MNLLGEQALVLLGLAFMAAWTIAGHWATAH